jgi:hypothetical protein
MQVVRKILGQSKPTTATAESILSPESGEVIVVQGLIACNVTGTEATFSIFADEDGTHYDDDTALFKGESLSANETIQIDFSNSVDSGLFFNDSNGNLGIKSGTASSTTFTVNGVILRQ